MVFSLKKKKNIYIYIYIYIYINSFTRVGRDTKSIFKSTLIGLNSEFSFSVISCHTKFKGLSLLYYLHFAVRRIQRLSCYVKCKQGRPELVSIFYDYNHYTTSAWIRIIIINEKSDKYLYLAKELKKVMEQWQWY